MDVKSAKIVAGSEVEKTNKLLNELAKAVLDKKPFVEAVEKVRKGQKPPEAAATTTTSTAASTSKTAAAAPTKKAPAAAASKAPTKAAPAPAARGKAPAATKGPQTKASGPAGKAAAPAAKAAASKAEKASKKPATPEPEIEQLEELGSIEAVAEKSLESSPKSLEPVETIETPQGLNIDVVDKVIEGSVDLNGNSSKPSSAKEEDSLQSVEPMAVINNNNNLDNNLDQLVAGLGLDDDEEEEEENGNALGEGGRPQQPEDSGIDSSSKSSVSANNDHSPKSGPDSAEISPRSTAFEVSSSTTPLEDQAEAEMPRAADRKRSATIKSSRRAASSKSGPPNQNTGGMTNGQLLSRSQNVPSSAAPMSYAATLPPNIPPPPYEESPQAPPPSAAAVHQRMTTAAAQRTSARPSSSRPAPPRVKTASRSRPQLGLLAENRVGEQVAAAGADQQSTTKADQQVWPPPEVLALDLDLDDRGDGEEEAAAAAAAAADEYVMSSQKLQEALLSMDNGVTADLGASINSSNNQGRLVQQLMETKSELEGNVAAAGGRKTSASVIAADSSLSSADTKVLRERVQQLCQSVGGLSKALNYLHEDVEPMVGELAKWSEEYRANSRAVERLQAELAKAVDPLRRELEAVELEVRHAGEQLINAKAAVHRNALTIARMIEGV